MNNETRISDLTVGQFKALMQETFGNQRQEEKKQEVPDIKLMKGIYGLANLLDCSRRYAQELKTRGVFDDAITQVGRVITFNPQEVLRIWNNMNQL